MLAAWAYDASNPFSRFFTSFSLGLFAPPFNHSWTFLTLTECVTLGLRASTSKLARRTRHAVMLPKRAVGQNRRVVLRPDDQLSYKLSPWNLNVIGSPASRRGFHRIARPPRAGRSVPVLASRSP
jgi:hypothetical protein